MSFEMEAFLPYRLHQAAESVSRDFQQHYKQTYGINRSEWRTLFHIGSYGPIGAAEISQRSRLDKTILSRAILKLEERGWVERQFRKGDRRGHDLVLTQEGSKTFEELRELASRFNKQLIKTLGSKQADRLLADLVSLEKLNQREAVD